MSKSSRQFERAFKSRAPVWACAALLTLVCQTAMAEYDAGTPITDVSITKPTGTDVWLIGTPHTVTCTTSTDMDRCRTTAQDPWHDVVDSVTHYWTCPSGSGTFLSNNNIGQSVTYICPNTAGTYTITVHADDNYAPDNNTAVVDEQEKTDSKTVSVVGLEIYQVGFGNSQPLKRTPTGVDSYNGWGDGTTAITNPVYDADDTAAEQAAKNHACFVMGSASAQLTAVRCRATAALTETSAFHLRATGGNSWAWALFTISSGNRESGAGTLSLDGETLSTCVKRYDGTYDCDWKFRCFSGSDTEVALNYTSHSVYLTYGTPAGSDVTVKRVQEVCGSAAGKQTLGDCADAVFAGLTGSFNLGADCWGPSPIWRLHNAGEKSQCPGLADYVNKHFQMLGLGAGVIRYCRALPNGTYEAAATLPGTQWRTITPGGEHPDPTTHDDDYASERLAMVDGDGNGNAFEATCLFNSTYYALGVGTFTTAKAVVKGAFTSVEWQYRTGAAEPFVFHKCTEAPWTEAP